jgi:hypothetical protein
MRLNPGVWNKYSYGYELIVMYLLIFRKGRRGVRLKAWSESKYTRGVESVEIHRHYIIDPIGTLLPGSVAEGVFV